MAFKKKLHKFIPDDSVLIETQRTRRLVKFEPSDPVSIERGVRQQLSDKVSGTMVGIWLLIAEHLRLGTWELLCGWCRRSGETVEPRLALQLVHEAALCLAGLRESRSLSQRGFELANGLPFVAADRAIHDLLSNHSVAEAQALQVALGRIRRAGGHYRGGLLTVDPHHMKSFSKRQMRRHRHKENIPATKTSQTFFCLDVETKQPLAFTVGSSARTATQATPGLLTMVADILKPRPGQTRILADTQHFSIQLFDHIVRNTPFDLLVPVPAQPSQIKRMQSIKPDRFTHRWAGLATAKVPYCFKDSATPLWLLVQRCGERPDNYQFEGFLSTSNCDELAALIIQYPDRWHVEEFFKSNQALGWNRAGTLNLNIRYGHMTMVLIAQAAIQQLRQRLRHPFSTWDAAHLARNIFQGLDGDIRVMGDTIVVTFYNAPHASSLRQQYQHLPQQLQREGVDPHIPWLYNFKLDFRFK